MGTELCGECKICEENPLGIHKEPFEFRGVKVTITTKVISENPPIEMTYVPGKLYGRIEDTVFIYMKKNGRENLECLNRSGLSKKDVNYLAKQLYYMKPNKTISSEGK